MQNIILITFKSGLVQYIPHNLEALDFISANFADIENYIVVEPAVQQKQVSEVVVAPVDLSDLTKREIIALAAALKSIEVSEHCEFGTIDVAFTFKQNLTGRNFTNAIKSLDEQCLKLADGKNAFLTVCYPYMNSNHPSASKETTFCVSEGLYAVRQYVYDQAGLK